MSDKPTTMMAMDRKLRTGHVTRWHIVATSRQQTVADHQYRVMVVAEEILRLLGMYDWDSDVTLCTMRLAFIHDRHEVLLGDIPTPGKVALREATREAMWGAMWGAAPCTAIDIPDVVGRAEANADPEFEELANACAHGEPLEVAGAIVKMADLLESIEWLATFGVGSHSMAVLAGLVAGVHAARDRMVTAVDRYQKRFSGLDLSARDKGAIVDFVNGAVDRWAGRDFPGGGK